MFSKKSLLIMSCLLLFQNLAYADFLSATSSGGGGKFFYLSADLKGGYSTEATDDETTLLSRKMATYAADAAFGIRLFHMIFGASGEYALVKQLTDPAKVSNSNTQGKYLAIAPLFGFEFSSFKLLFKFPKVLSGDYTLDQKNSSGQEVKYKDAKILGAQLQMMTGASTFLGVEYQKLTYQKINMAGTDTTLSSSAYLNLSTISLMYGISY